MKRRRSLLLIVLLLSTAATVVVAVLGALVRYEPAAYRAACREEDTDAAKSTETLSRVTELQQELQIAKPDWGGSFAAADFNAFLRDSFERGGTFDGTLDRRVRSPRVWTDGDRLTIAARYQASPFASLESEWTTTVVSVELKVWVVSKKSNTVAVEVCRLAAGALPISAQRYLDRLGEAARESNTEVTWYRNAGHPVGLFRFYASQPQAPVQIQSVTVADGRLTVAGKGVQALADAANP